MSPTRPIAYYVTAHGYGHGVRSCDIIGAIQAKYPDQKLIVVSDLPADFFEDRLGSSPGRFRPASFDVGMVQLDSIRVDPEASLERVERLVAMRSSLVRGEMDFLKAEDIGLVVVDIPGVPLEAAAGVGVPRVAVGNFGWDWVYSDLISRNGRWAPAVEMFREQYGLADLLLRLPFSEPMRAFPKREDMPLLSTPGRRRRGELAAYAGCSPDTKWGLISFTTLDLSEDALARVESIEDVQFFTVLPLEWNRRNICAVDRKQILFSDVLASVDVVISKPGYGILSECAVNGKPLIYADRSDFAEYRVLEEAIQKYFRNVHIPSAKLYSGEWRESLEQIRRRPEPELHLQRGGAEIAADRISELLTLYP